MHAVEILAVAFEQTPPPDDGNIEISERGYFDKFAARSTRRSFSQSRDIAGWSPDIGLFASVGEGLNLAAEELVE